MVDDKFLLRVPTYHAPQMVRTWCNRDAVKTQTDRSDSNSTVPSRHYHASFPSDQSTTSPLAKTKFSEQSGNNDSKIHTRYRTTESMAWQTVYASGCKRQHIIYHTSHVECYIRASFLLDIVPAKVLGLTWTTHCLPERGPRRKPF